MTDYMVTGMMKRRAELAGELTQLQARLGELARNLETMDAALKLVAPDLDIPAIAPRIIKPPEDWSKRGEMSRVVLSILRVSRKSMTSREIAAEMIVQRGLVATPQLLNIMSKRIAGCLRDKRDRGLVRVASDPQAFWLEYEIAI
jgi:hypothetical protein